MHKLLLNEVLFIIGQSLPYCSHLMLLLMNRSALPLLLMNRPALPLLELITMLTIDDRKGFKYSTTAGISSLRNCKNTISKQRRPPREEHCTAGSTPDVPKHPPGTVIDSSLCTSFYNPMGGHELVPWHKGAGRDSPRTCGDASALLGRFRRLHFLSRETPSQTGHSPTACTLTPDL